jgi:hypothetical protein
MLDPSFSPYRYVSGVVVFFGLIVGCVAIAEIIADEIIYNAGDHRDEATSATRLFYSHLKKVNEINIQLVSTTLSPEMRSELTEQRDLLEVEMRLTVQQIPVGFRTSQMYPYSSN